MPNLKPNAIRDMAADEIETRVAELRQELFNLRFRNGVVGSLRNAGSNWPIVLSTRVGAAGEAAGVGPPWRIHWR